VENISIDTTQNVSLEYSIASIGERMVATLIDLIIQFAYFLFIMLIMKSAVGSLGSWLVFIILIPVFFYNLLCETFIHGQSFGKMVMKIKVVMHNGTQAGFLSYLIRWMFRLIENPFVLLNGIGILSIVINGKGQRLGDIVAGTVVIRNKKNISLFDTMLVATAEDYVPMYPDAYKLSDEEINIIREVVEAYRKDRDNKNHVNFLLLAKQKIEKRLGVSSTLHPYTFLTTVLKDYNQHYSGGGG